MNASSHSNSGRRVAGEVKRPTCEVVYFSDLGAGSVVEQFDRLTNIPPPITIERGGATPENCTLVLPDGSRFHALEYHGDIPGWANDLARSARTLGALLARIDDGIFIVSDGRKIPLGDCTVAPREI